MTHPTPQLLTVRQVAETLSISVAGVWRGVKTGVLPRPIKIGGATRWRRTDLDALIAQTT